MSTSRPTKWTKIALISLLVLLVTCSLMSWARLQGSVLTSKASSYISNDKTWSTDNIEPSDWYRVDEYTLRFSKNIPPFEDEYSNFLYSCGVSVSCVGGYALEYYVKLIYSNNTVVESSWKSVNDIQYIAWDWRGHSLSNNCTIQYYIRRSDGVSLSASSMYRGSVFAYGYNNVPFEYPSQTTAIPPEWLDTTTQTYQTATTATRPAAYDDLVGTVPALTPDIGGTPPGWFDQFNPINKSWFLDVLSSLADWFDVVDSIANQIPIFWVMGGFVITGLLLAWLLH